MKRLHVPLVDGRYWMAITLASIFGTNLGDLYAHELHLGIWLGLLILSLLATVAFVLERRDPKSHEGWYWLVIIIIRTGATNIADFLAFRARIPAAMLAGGLVALQAILAWCTHRTATRASETAYRLPATDAVYWAAMLTAGVLGTVLGDDASRVAGQGVAAIALGLLLGGVLLITRGSARSAWLYWGTVATARTAGTAMGDWLAENHLLNIGLPRATLISGAIFIGVVALRDKRRKAPGPA